MTSRLFLTPYHVTESGKVYNAYTRHFLKPQNGRVRLHGQWYTITHLVALLYVPNPNNATRVARKRGTSNHYSNLRWITPKAHNPKPALEYNGTTFTSIQALALYAGVTRMTINRWIKNGKVKRQQAPCESKDLRE